MKTLLFDTNSYSLYVRGDNKLKKLISKADIVYLSVVTVGELYAGFYKGDKFELNEKILSKFISSKHVKIVNISPKIAKIYGNLYVKLKKNGELVPTNDVWIVACAIETNSTVITYDKHFLKIPKVKVWKELKK